ALVVMARFHGFAVDPAQVAHQYGNTLDTTTILRCAQHLGLRARAVASNGQRLRKTALPAIAVHASGKYFIVAKVSGTEVLIQNPASGETATVAMEELADVWPGTLILMTRRATIDSLRRRFDVTWFLGAMMKYRRLLAEVLIASFFLQIFALVSPLFFQVVIDKVLVHRGLSTLDVIIAGLVGIAVFETVLTALRTFVFAHTTSRIDVELGARLFRHLMALPVAYFEARRTGDSVARVRELENIRNFLTSSALTLVIDLFFTIVFVVVMALYSMPLTLIVAASIPFYAGISLLSTPLFRRRLDEKFERGAENQSFLVESINGVETLKAMAVEPQMQRRWEEQLAGYVKASFDVLSLGNWTSQAVQLVNKLTTAAILYAGANAVMATQMTVGELVAFNMLAGRVAQPILRLAQIWQEFHQTRISIERLGDILNAPPEPSITAGQSMPPRMQGAIRFENVSFRYRSDGRNVLDGITLDIPAGQSLGVVGVSGSGKSTLAKLMQRLHIPSQGRVTVDGVDVAAIDVAWLRRQIGVVLQESMLFNRSVRENIALSDPAMPMDRVIQAATLAGAHEFIAALPQGYDTIIGEKGVGLSGGQRQRVAIARALVHNPRLLIFDEATSALDYESESAIHANMKAITHGRTVVVIAHRLSAVKDCDRIITIENGRIVEDGSHETLLRGTGRYAALWRHQAGGV
ncbi:MAG: type I secretion system permease/ATPase, partial [Parvibaculum sp.]